MGWASATPGKVKTTSLSVAAVFDPRLIIAEIDWAKLVTIDFETYYDQDYTLSKLSTSEYIRDKRFKAHMMGIKVGNKKRRVVPAVKIAQALREIDWSTHSLLCHNTAFDGFILSHHYEVIPKIYYDTLSMARGLHSNDIGASLGEVAQYYGKGNKIQDVLEQTRGIRVLPPKLYKDCAEYCGVDVDLTLEIFIEMVKAFPETEMRMVDMTIRMFCDPVLFVDIPRVQKELEREISRREDLFMNIVDVTKYDEKTLLKTSAERALEGKERHMLMVKRIIGSNEKFAELIRAEGVKPPMKISPAWMKKKPAERDDADKWAYAFAKDDIAFTELPDKIEEISRDLDLNKKSDVKVLAARQQRLRDLVDCRIAVKSTTNITRAERFLKAGADGMPLPVGYSYARAHTLRWGGNNKMNMQNLTRGGELRQSILAPPGQMICVQDSGQIEARVNGWLWGQDDLLEAFAIADAFGHAQDKLPKAERTMATGENRDAYCRFADAVYGFEVTKANDMERFVGKVCVLGLGFQMGAAKLQATLAKGALGGPPVFFSMEMCQKIVNTYRRKNHRITAGWNICKNIIEDMAAGREGSWKCLRWEFEKIWLPNGMCLQYPDLKKSFNEDKGWEEWTYRAKDSRKKLYGGLLCENLVQCLARLIVGEQMLEIGKTHRVVMITHDEVVALAAKRAADKAMKIMMKAMTTPPAWCPDIPLNAEGGYAENYSK